MPIFEVKSINYDKMDCKWEEISPTTIESDDFQDAADEYLANHEFPGLIREIRVNSLEILQGHYFTTFKFNVPHYATRLAP